MLNRRELLKVIGLIPIATVAPQMTCNSTVEQSGEEFVPFNLREYGDGTITLDFEGHSLEIPKFKVVDISHGTYA